MLWLGLSMEQGRWESVCGGRGGCGWWRGGVDVCWCDAVGGWEDENLYKWKILFGLNIAFRLLIRCRGEATPGREGKQIRWIHLNMLWKCTRLTDIELREAEMALLIRWKWYLVCAYNSQRMRGIFFYSIMAAFPNLQCSCKEKTAAKSI